MVRDSRNDGRRRGADRTRGRQSGSRRDDARTQRSSNYNSRNRDSFADIDDFGDFGASSGRSASSRPSRRTEERRESVRETPRRQREVREPRESRRSAPSARGGAHSTGSRIADGLAGLSARAAGSFVNDVRAAFTPGEDDDDSITRERFLVGAFGGVSALIALRLLQVQIFQHGEYSAAAAKKRTADGLPVPASRGTIYDRNGNVLASSVSTRQVILNPSKATGDHRELARRVAEAVGGNAADYEKALENDQSQYYLVARQVDVDVAQSLTDLAGVELVEDARRMYPYLEVAGQVVGASNMEGEGLTGLESYYNDVIEGTDGSITIQRGLHGEPIPGGVEREEPPVDGEDVVISIDLELQQYAEAKLAAAVEEWQADSGQFVIMDAANGEIYAIGSTPYLDPGDLQNANSESLQLKPVNWVYEPGSTFKCVTAAALLNEGALTADTVIDVASILEIDDYKISDSHDHDAMKMTFRDVIAESSNIGTVAASELIGPEVLYSYIERLGFTSLTGIDYPGDTQGLLLPLDQWNKATEMNVPFGQGISVSSVQLVRGLAAIRNGGVMVTPHLLIDMPQNKSYSKEWPTEQVLSEQTCDDLNDILASVVEYGTGTNAAIEGYTVVGKTGTAQKIDSETGAYSDVEYVTSFIGWLPNTDCTLVCLVALDNPKTAAGGGLVAGPVFADIMSFACDRYKVAPDVSANVAGVKNANEGAGA